jgi:hypothetical protein
MIVPTTTTATAATASQMVATIEVSSGAQSKEGKGWSVGLTATAATGAAATSAAALGGSPVPGGLGTFGGSKLRSGDAESGLVERLDKIDLGSVQQLGALVIDHEGEAVDGDDVVAGLRAVERHAEPRAPVTTASAAPAAPAPAATGAAPAAPAAEFEIDADRGPRLLGLDELPDLVLRFFRYFHFETVHV